MEWRVPWQRSEGERETVKGFCRECLGTGLERGVAVNDLSPSLSLPHTSDIHMNLIEKKT